MRRLSLLASLSVGTLVAVSCTSTASTAPPGTPLAPSPSVAPQSVAPEASPTESAVHSVDLPSIPPLPSVDLPSIPPLPSFSIPPLPSFSIPPLPSFEIPSFEPDTELEGLFPEEVLGAPVTVETARAAAFLDLLPAGSEQRTEFETFIASLGVGIDAVSIGSGRFEREGSTEEISAFRAAGVETERLSQSFLAFAKSSADDPAALSLKEAVVGGKSVTVVTNSADETTSYAYGVRDVVFIIETDTPAVAEAVMGALP